MRTSLPSALIWNRSPFEPGTRSISPKEQKITPGRRAMACARSSISSGVTQAGQTGPCTSSTAVGGFGQIFEAGFAENAAEVHLGHHEALRIMQADDFPRYGQAHLEHMLAGIAGARWRWESGGHLDRTKTHKKA